MIRSARTFAVTIALALGSLASCEAEKARTPIKDAPESRYATKNVVIVVLDGERYTETWGDPRRRNIPHLARDLAPLGVVCTNFRNEGSTRTNPGHVALVTGRYESVWNDGWELPGKPTITQFFLKHTGLPSTAAAVVTSKDKLHILADSRDPAWHGRYVATTNAGRAGFGTGYRADRNTWRALRKILRRDHPRLVVVNFFGPDSAGHSGRWEAYLGAIRECDRYVWELWQSVQSDPFYAGKTALLVTNDHGCHDDGYGGIIGHGCECEGCTRLMLFAAGPDFRRGVVVEEKRELIDIVPTVAELLGFPAPDAAGSVMSELFVNAQPGAPAPGTGKPPPAGAAIGLRAGLVIGRRKLASGEPIDVAIHIKAVGAQDILIFDGGHYSKWRYFFSPKGGGRRWQAYRKPKGPGEYERKVVNVRLAKGERKVAVRCRIGGDGWRFVSPGEERLLVDALPPGTYSVTASYETPKRLGGLEKGRWWVTVHGLQRHSPPRTPRTPRGGWVARESRRGRFPRRYSGPENDARAPLALPTRRSGLSWRSWRPWR